MSEPDGKKWVTCIVLLLVLLIVLAVVLGSMVTIGSGAYVGKFASNSVGVAGHTETMTKFQKATLYPYAGSADFSAVGKTADQCVATCLDDATCRGFYHHNALSGVADQNSCHFYRNNNVETMLGTNTEVSPYFVDTALVFGAQLPGSSTDTYIKEGQAFKMFRSSFDKAQIASA